jgi:hypothetical protein
MRSLKGRKFGAGDRDVPVEGSSLPDAVLYLGEPVAEGPEALWATIVTLAALVAAQLLGLGG